MFQRSGLSKNEDAARSPAVAGTRFRPCAGGQACGHGVGGVRQAKTPPFLVIPLFFCGVSLWVQRSADFHVPGESGIPRYRPLRSAVGSRGNAESGGRRGKTTTLRGHGNIPRSFLRTPWPVQHSFLRKRRRSRRLSTVFCGVSSRFQRW